MKVLLAVHHFPSHHIGGAELRALRYATQLQAMGHSVRVVCLDEISSGPPGALRYVDDMFQGVAVRRLSFNLGLSTDPFRSSYRNPLIGEHVQRMLTDYKPDVLHLISGYLMSGSVLEAARSLGVPTVVMPVDFWFVCPRITLRRPDGSLCEGPTELVDCSLCLLGDRRRTRLANRLTLGLYHRPMRWLLQKTDVLAADHRATLAALCERRAYLQKVMADADVMIVSSRFLRDMLNRYNVRSRRVVELRQGVDVKTTAPISKPAVNSSGVSIGFIGQLAEHKGVHILIRAFKRLRVRGVQPTLTIYGDQLQNPPYVRHLRRLAGDSDRIWFAGSFDHAKIRRIHSGLDLLVVPSLWYENSPNVILEASATHTPVIASDIGGMSEMLGGRDEALFCVGSVEDLSNRLQRLVEQPALLVALLSTLPETTTIDEEMQELLRAYRARLPVGSQ